MKIIMGRMNNVGKLTYEEVAEMVFKKGGKLLCRIHNAITGVDEILVQIDGKNIYTTLSEFMQ